jgi:heavy metal translocating P-type ATPase
MIPIYKTHRSAYTGRMNDPKAALLAELAEERRKLRTDMLLTILTGLGLTLGIATQLTAAPLWSQQLTFGLAYLAGAIPAGISALRALLKGSIEIELLMVLAALAAAGVGETRDGAILLFLFSLAGTLEAYALGNTKRAVVSLMQLRPDEATRQRTDGSTERVGVEALKLGDTVLIKPGERLPIDGVILRGQSAIDQSPITGESVPVDKQPDDLVFAGTVNGYGALAIRVTKLAGESTLARMITLVTEAQAQRAPSERFSRWFGARYTLAVLVGSALALAIFLMMGMPQQDALYRAATLLVVASPCAIVISVPAAILSALAAAARQGVLFKGGAALEDFGRATCFAFDKTGTLTEGKMQVTDVVALDGNPARLLQLAATLEANSEHPLAKSILNHASALGIAPKTAHNFTAIPGQGLTAEIDGQRCWAGNPKLMMTLGIPTDPALQHHLDTLATQGKTLIVIGDVAVRGVIAIADTLRASTKAMLAQLRQAGVKRFAMLTGDTEAVAQRVAQTLGLDSAAVYASLLPEDKVRLVRELAARERTAFVGDGINDAAALACATVGVAMGSAGSDVALEAADVALLSDDLEALPKAYRLAGRANRVVRQNLAFALGIMLLMVMVTLFWHLPLPLGVIGHEGGTLLVVANGLRLMIGSKPKGRPAASAPARAQAVDSRA